MFGHVSDADDVLASDCGFSSSRKEQSEMRAVLLFLYISTSVPVIRGTLSKTDAKKLNKLQEAEVRSLFFLG